MNNLNESLALIIEKMKKFRPLYQQNEQAVREQIVNPILMYLGWDTMNPEEVQPNVSTEEGIPDYSLIKNKKTILFVEVKKLGVDIEQKDVIRQLAKYSFGEGTEYGILTNGAIWMLIRSFEVGTNLNERTVWRIDLENEDLVAVCRKITTVSKTNIEQIGRLVKKAQILDEIWQSLTDDPEEMIKGLMPVVKSLINQGYPDYQFEDTEIEDLLKGRVKEMISTSSEETMPPEMFPEEPLSESGNPRKMKLKGETFELRYSYEIMINTANWLIKNGKLKLLNCPVGIGRGKRYLINKEPKHAYGGDFFNPKKLSGGLWIEANHSTAGCIRNTKKLLEKFGVSPESLTLE